MRKSFALESLLQHLIPGPQQTIGLQGKRDMGRIGFINIPALSDPYTHVSQTAEHVPAGGQA